ncbi:TPA: nucleotidyl transferase AbiEii/AbiGii toxin family protein [Candidatus Micrarchaeota archaeon]|nr:nucleotidyl transferase AbiEii/AbiGii toxin family protein [Candidatus Micrarchaeota archaeon]
MISQNIITDVSEKENIGWLIVEKDYFLTLLLDGISKSNLKEKLVFKGGTALRKIYFKHYRYSEDLDFTLRIPLKEKEIEESFKEIFEYLKNEYNAEFIIRDFYSKKWFSDIKIQFVGLRGVKNTIALDLMSDELISDKIEEKPVFNPYYEKKFSIPVYSMDEILAEKLRSFLQRTRVRDYYDVWYILTHEKDNIDRKKLKNFLIKKVEYKKLQMPVKLLDKGRVEQARPYYQRQLGYQIDKLPSFDSMIADLEKSLAGLGF